MQSKELLERLEGLMSLYAGVCISINGRVVWGGSATEGATMSSFISYIIRRPIVDPRRGDLCRRSPTYSAD